MTSVRPSVLFMLPSLNGGGAERVALSVLGALDRSRWSPALMLVRPELGALEYALPEDVPVVRLGATRARSAVVAILHEIWRRRPKIVFVTLDHMNALVGLLRPLMPPGTRLVLRVTDLGSLQIGWLRKVLAVSLRMSDVAIYQSEAMYGTYRKELRLGSGHRGVVIRNALALDRVKASASAISVASDIDADATRLTLVAAGRLVPAKGFDLLIRAVSMLNDPRLRLFILGEGPMESQLSELISQEGLSDSVHLCGFVDNPYAWYARADAFVLSSRSEGFPNVVLEALACGVPVIATPMPGLEGVPGVMLSSEVSVEALAIELARLLDERPTFPHEAVAARLAEHDVARVVVDYGDVFCGLTTSGGSQGRGG